MTPTTWSYALTPQQMGYRDASPVATGVWRMGTPASGERPAASVYVASLAHAAHPDVTRPAVAVVVPDDWRPTAALGMALYIHGHSNGVVNVLGKVQTQVTPGGKLRNWCDLTRQFVDSRANALLVLPEVSPDKKSGVCGALARPEGFQLFLNELMVRLLPVLGAPGRHVTDIARLTIMAHSGGFVSVAAALRATGLPDFRQVVLLDALYAESSTFERWVKAQRARPAGATDPAAFRFASVYTDEGGTMSQSRALAERLGHLSPPTPFVSFRHDTSKATLTPAEYDVQVLFKHSELTHPGVSRYYPRHFFAAAGFEPR